MARFAKVDRNNIVETVLVVDNKELLDENGEEKESKGVAFLNKIFGVNDEFTWVQTSYNTYAGRHLLGKTPFRKNHAGMGYTYDEDRDAFMPPKPFDSWILNEDTCQYDPPVERPDDGNRYIWNEDTTSWDEVAMEAE